VFSHRFEKKVPDDGVEAAPKIIGLANLTTTLTTKLIWSVEHPVTFGFLVNFITLNFLGYLYNSLFFQLDMALCFCLMFSSCQGLLNNNIAFPAAN
jgi:hypothetical protein